MAWVFFQVFLAFGVGVAIVWWTWPKNPKGSQNSKIPTKPASTPPPADASAHDR